MFVGAPAVLGTILHGGDDVSPRHKIESARELRAIAANGPEAPAGTRFVIQINLGSDVLTFDKSIRPLEPGEVDPFDSSPDPDTNIDADADAAPQNLLAALAAKNNSGDGGCGEPI